MPSSKTGLSARAKNKALPNEEQRARLKLAMAEAKLNQVELSALSKVDQAGISRWLKGERDMAALQLLRVAHFAGVRLDWLLTGHEPKRSMPVVGLRVDPDAAADPAVNARARELLSDPPRPPEQGAQKHRRRAR